MATRCTPEQVAEAVTIWSIDRNFSLFKFKEIEDTAELKPLDLLLSTVRVVLSAFSKQLQTEWDEHKRQIVLSKRNFIHYLKPRCLLLVENRGCFNLVLMLAFFSLEIFSVSFHHDCFHLARNACKLLKNILEDKFAETFHIDSEWEVLTSFCKKILAAVYPSRKYRPATYDTDEEEELVPRNPITKYGIFWIKPSSDEQLNEEGNIRQERLDSSDGDHNSNPREIVSDETAGNESIPPSDIVDATDKEAKNDSHLRDSEVLRGRIGHESVESGQKSVGDASLPQGQPEFTSAEHDVKSLEPPLVKEIVDERIADSPVIVDSSDDEGLADDAVYWSHALMRNATLRKRTTDSRQHLEDTLKLLAKIKGKIATESLPSDTHDISLSDDEDIEVLEERVRKPNYSDWQINLSAESVENIKKKICAKRNEKLGNSSQNLVLPEDITDGEVFQSVISIFEQSDEEEEGEDDYCKICIGKMLTFKTKWAEKFHEKYPGKVSDFFL